MQSTVDRKGDPCNMVSSQSMKQRVTSLRCFHAPLNPCRGMVDVYTRTTLRPRQARLTMRADYHNMDDCLHEHVRYLPSPGT